MLDWLVSEHGHRDWADFTREAVLLIRDDNKDRPSWANHMIDIIGVVGNFVRDRPKTFHLPRGWQNPASRVKHLKTGEGHMPWEEEQIEKFREEWSWACFERVVFETYLNTGQRTSDVRKMMRSHYHKGEISVAQEKTDERVWIPVLDDLKEILDPWLDSSTHQPFFPIRNGKDAMGKVQLSALMREAMTMAGLPATCTLHGFDIRSPRELSRLAWITRRSSRSLGTRRLRWPTSTRRSGASRGWPW